MIYSLSGTLEIKRENFFIINTGSISFKLFGSASVLSRLPNPNEEVQVFTYLHSKDDIFELYGFLEEQEMGLFTKLNTISGIGPKSALGILGIGKIDHLIAAINEGKTELLTRASGVGRRTAERIVLELKGKLSPIEASQLISQMESDVELEETLVSLGYTRAQAKTALSKIDSSVTGFKERLKEALRNSKTT